MIRRHPMLGLFTALYCVGFLAWALSQGNGEFIFYFAVMLVMIGLMLWADVRARFTPLVLWLLSVWGLAHMAGGNVPIPADGLGFGTTAKPDEAETVLYNLWLLPGHALKYDQLTHAYGFFAATTACWQALRRSVASNVPLTLGVFVMLACAGMGLGAVNEIVEYIATLRGPTNVGGYANNAQDLIFNGAGAVCAAMAAWTGARAGRGANETRINLAGLAATLVASVVIGLLLARFARGDA